MQSSAKTWLGHFPFCLSGRVAVDEELHSLIVNSGNDATANIFQKLQQMTIDKCHEDCQCHLHLVRSK